MQFDLDRSNCFNRSTTAHSTCVALDDLIKRYSIGLLMASGDKDCREQYKQGLASAIHPSLQRRPTRKFVSIRTNEFKIMPKNDSKNSKTLSGRILCSSGL
jgi:hypothetical protein